MYKRQKLNREFRDAAAAGITAADALTYEGGLRLLEQEKVAVVPGTAFGDCGEGYLRISYAYSLQDLKRALERMGRFVASLEEM